MNPLVPAPIDVVYSLLALVAFVLAIVALVMVWREYAEKRDISRALLLSILTVFVPFIGAIATIVNVRQRKNSTLNSL